MMEKNASFKATNTGSQLLSRFRERNSHTYDNIDSANQTQCHLYSEESSIFILNM